MKKLLLTVVVLAVVGLSNTQAGDFGMKGQWELGGSVSYSSTSLSGTNAPSGSVGIFTIEPYAGYFVTDQFELGLRPVVSIISPSSGSSSTNLVILAAPAWNFKLTNPTVTPFIEGLVGFNSYSPGGGSSISGLAYGGAGGIKVLVGESGLLNLGVQFISTDLDPLRTNTFGVAAGFTVFVH